MKNLFVILLFIDIIPKSYVFMNYMFKAVNWRNNRGGEERNLRNCCFVKCCEMCCDSLI